MLVFFSPFPNATSSKPDAKKSHRLKVAELLVNLILKVLSNGKGFEWYQTIGL